MAKGRFGGADFQPHHLGAEPAAPVARDPDQTGDPVPVSAPPTAAAVAPTSVSRARPAGEGRAPASKSLRVSFSSRVSPEALQQLQDYAHEKKRSQADVLAEALNLFFRAKKLDEVA
jgi:hypothetical protein